jgi:GNAT superfamily N-acetyltransferase
MAPIRATGSFDWDAILSLIQTAFAYMDGRIDLPPSMNVLTAANLEGMAKMGEVWVIGSPPIACVVLTARKDHLYIGKLCVAPSHRGQGLARALIKVAEACAKARCLPFLELQMRIELVENQNAFRALGFAETQRCAHPG